MSTRAPGLRAGSAAVSMAKLADYVELTKPRLTALVLFATLAGYVAGSAGAVDATRLVAAILGTWLCAGGSHALNMLMEREADGRMRRTAGRPLPAGRIHPAEALCLGAGLVLLGLSTLALAAGFLATTLAAVTVATYLLLYTPLKSRSSLNTLVGAVSGATPVLVGHAAATGRIGHSGWFLFAIVFVWQIPHFLAIAWMYRDDYARAGYPMLPVLDASGEITSRQIVVHSVELTLVSLLPTVVGEAGILFAAVALALGAYLTGAGFGFLRRRSRAAARRVFHASLVYLPALMCVYLVEILS